MGMVGARIGARTLRCGRQLSTSSAYRSSRAWKRGWERRGKGSYRLSLFCMASVLILPSSVHTGSVGSFATAQAR